MGSAADGGLTKFGSGNLTLAGSNTYIGITTVESGSLTMTGNMAIQNDARWMPAASEIPVRWIAAIFGKLWRADRSWNVKLGQ